MAWRGRRGQAGRKEEMGVEMNRQGGEWREEMKERRERDEPGEAENRGKDMSEELGGRERDEGRERERRKEGKGEVIHKPISGVHY